MGDIMMTAPNFAMISSVSERKTSIMLGRLESTAQTVSQTIEYSGKAKPDLVACPACYEQ